MSQYFQIDLYSHHFTITKVQPRGREVVEKFAKNYVQMGLVKVGRQFTRAPIKVYAARIGNYEEYRFHINQYPEFTKHLSSNEVLPHTYTVCLHDPDPGVDIELDVLPGWIPRDYQVPIIEYNSSDKPKKSKLVEIQPGKGKSLIAMIMAAKLKKRVGFVIKPAYIEKWIDDVKKVLGVKRNEIEVIQGSGQLMSLISRASAGELNCKVIIFSNKTLQNWFTLYERKSQRVLDDGYDCTPQELFPICGIGLRIIDEVHQDFHLNFKVDLYTQVDWSISLSATLRSDDAFVNRMYEVAYPRSMRYAGLAYDKYIQAFSWLYQVDKPGLIKTTEWGSTTYTHHAFEKSVIKDRVMLANYLKMIQATVDRFYYRTPEHVKGDRCLVYCSSIQMCTLVAEYLSNQYRDKVVKRYCEDDDYDNLMNSDISVSTLLSAGTGHDISGLTAVILTTAIMSSQSNIQGFGRLRNLPNKVMRFAYFVCTDVPKHVEYHEKKKVLLDEMARSYSSINYPVFI
jgi:superfamily II DNA or RNA helicase